MADIRITPAVSVMAFTSSLNFKETLTQEASGSLTLLGSGSTGRTDLFTINGNNGTLFSVSDDLSNSLFSVNTIAGLPVIEAFANNTVIMGQYGQNVLIVTGSRVGIGTATPQAKLSVTGTSGAFDDVGIFQITSGTGVYANLKLTFGVNNSGYTWIQSVLPGTDIRPLIINPAGGYVGIGTTDPSSLLSIRGTSTVLTITDTTYNRTSRIGYIDSANLYLANDSASNTYMGAYNNVFLVYGGGRVGVGTTSPTVKLDTVGYVKDTKFISTEQEPFSTQAIWSGDVIEGNIDGSVSQWDLISLDYTTDIWYLTNDTNVNSTYLLGIYLGENLVLLEGHITVHDSAGSGDGSAIASIKNGLPIYIRDGGSGDMSGNIPITTGNYVRILGHPYYKSSGSSGNYIMRFRPSNDWIKL